MDKKKINKKQPPVSERHFGVILENIDSKLVVNENGVNSGFLNLTPEVKLQSMKMENGVNSGFLISLQI